MKRIINPTENVFNAVGVVVADGFAVVEGTKSAAVPYCERVVSALEPYEDISPVTSYQNVENHGYLYLVVDTNRFSASDPELRSAVEELDRNNPC